MKLRMTQVKKMVFSNDRSVFVDKEKFRIFRSGYHRYNGLKEIGNDEIFEGKLGEIAIPPSTFR